MDLEIGLEGNWLDNAVQELHLVPRISTFRHGVPYSLGLGLYRALDQGPQVIENAATELVSYFFSGAQDRQPPAWLRRVLEMAEVKEGQPLSLLYVAGEVGVHPVHVARSFRHFFGCSFGDYLTKLRVRKASELLLIRGHTIAEVAHICGFADHAHLCRTFKRLTGLTPSGFRCKVQLPKIRPENSLLQVNPA